MGAPPPTCGAKRKRHDDNVTSTNGSSATSATNDGENEDSSSTEDAGLSLLFAASLLQATPRRDANNNKKSRATGSASDDENKEVIATPRQMDVCCGRGGGVNSHTGNIMYRRIVEYNKPIYRHVPKRHRMLVSQSIVQAILNHGGRFLQQREPTLRQQEETAGAESVSRGVATTPNMWEEISFRRAVQKTSQALRERVDNEAPTPSANDERLITAVRPLEHHKSPKTKSSVSL